MFWYVHTIIRIVQYISIKLCPNYSRLTLKKVYVGYHVKFSHHSYYCQHFDKIIITEAYVCSSRHEAYFPSYHEITMKNLFLFNDLIKYTHCH